MQHYIYASLHVDAARRFYQTKVEEANLKDNGKYETKLVQQRRQNRIKRVSGLLPVINLIINFL